MGAGVDTFVGVTERRSASSRPLLLDVSSVAYSYRGSQAVVDCSLVVPEGRIIALIGSNGAGKTTTVKMIAGALKPSAGRIKFAGADVTGWPAYRVVDAGVTLVPEGRLVFPSMTVLENLLVGSRARRGRALVDANLDRVFSLFPRLAQRRQQIAGSLSGGEQQMLAIGRGLMASPRLLMLDEPSLGLGPKLVKTIFSLIGALNREGLSVLLVEQNVRQALAIAHHAYVLEKGRTVREGTGRDLLADPSVKEAFLGLT
jgi:branched-chain amino acid transport system ATP-binding protein